MNYAPLVRQSFHDMSGIIEVWASACEQLVAYEHEADETVKTTHVHLIMMGCKYKTAEPLKRLYYKMFPAADKSEGNGLWSWTNKEHPVPTIDFITYMSKGHLRPKFCKGILPDKLEELRGKWVEPTPRSSTQTFIQLPEKPKITKHTLMLKVVNLILAEHINSTEEQRKVVLRDLDDAQWIKSIRKVLLDEKQMLGLYKVMDIYDCCIMYYAKDKFISNCLHIIEKRNR